MACENRKLVQARKGMKEVRLKLSLQVTVKEHIKHGNAALSYTECLSFLLKCPVLGASSADLKTEREALCFLLNLLLRS